MTRFKKASAVLLILLVSLMTFGCANQAETPAGKDAPATVRMVYWPGPESEAMQKVVDWFNANEGPKTGTKVELVLFSREGFWEKQESILAAKSPEVDIIFTASYIVGRHAPHLEPLDSVFAQTDNPEAGSLTTFLSRGLDSLKVDGKVYALPMDISNHFLYYRKDLIDRLLSDPAWQSRYRELAKQHLGMDLAPKPVAEWNWDDFIATALFFTKKYNPDSPTEYGTVLQMKNLIYNVMIWNDVLWSLGGSWFKPDGTPAFDTPEAKKALEVYTSISKLGVTPEGSTNYEYPEANEAFKTGKVAVMLQWSAAFHELNDPTKSSVADKVAIGPIPGEKHATHIHSLGVGLSRYSQNKEAAVKWLQFLATPKAMQMYAEAGGIPPVESVLKGMGEKRPEFPVIADHVERYGFVESTAPNVQSILEVLAKHLSGAWALQTTPEEALKAIQRDLAAQAQ